MATLEEALDPVVPAVDAVDRSPPDLWILLVGRLYRRQHAGNVGRIVLAVGIQHHQPVAPGLPGGAENGQALAHALLVAEAASAGNRPAVESPTAHARSHRCIIDIEQLVVVAVGHGGLNFGNQRSNIFRWPG